MCGWVQGTGFYHRQYMVAGEYLEVESLASTWASEARQGLLRDVSAVGGFEGHNVTLFRSSSENAVTVLLSGSADAVAAASSVCDAVCTGTTTPPRHVRPMCCSGNGVVPRRTWGTTRTTSWWRVTLLRHV